MSSSTSVSFQFDGAPLPITLETGRLARQATSSVYASCGNARVLATVCAKPTEAVPSFVMLTVDYFERHYSAGSIPGGFLKREGQPSVSETISARLIDRMCRPLLPKTLKAEVQLVVMVVSNDETVPVELLGGVAASAAMQLSGLPFEGPVGVCRVSELDGQFVVNSKDKQATKNLDLIVAAKPDSVVMVESCADELTEDRMLAALEYGCEQLKHVHTAIEKLVGDAGRGEVNPDYIGEKEVTVDVDAIEAKFRDAVVGAYTTSDKIERNQKLAEIHQACEEAFADEEGSNVRELQDVISKLEKAVVRERILSGQPRIDGRDTTTVRPINIEVGELPTAHGSVVFTRGETQALVSVTLGSERDSQLIDSIHGESKDPFMLHYNFPPFCVGEIGFMGRPKRREHGHGNLARRALTAMLPDMEEFPYVLRIVSEILESNGSSSMATVCGGSMALMDAGVPIKKAVAGVAMGLVKEGDDTVVLTDILGDEDHLGDMDFKVAGTQDGVTALQMDIKIAGITKETMSRALAQAKEARMHILGKMNDVISAPREEVADNAPIYTSIKINPDKIKTIIGRGGSTIKEITETYQVSIDISDDGTVKIYSPTKSVAKTVQGVIEELSASIEVGKQYEGKVIKVLDFGAVMSLPGNNEGLLHISQISKERINDIHTVVKMDDVFTIKVIDMDQQGRIRLSKREVVVSSETQEGNEE